MIGGSHAAVAFVETLRSDGFRGKLTLISEEKLPLFSPTALPYLLGKREKGPKALRPMEFYKGLSVIEDQAVIIDPNRSIALLKGGAKVAYDRLVIATGASAARVVVEGSSEQDILTLRSLRDLERLEKRVKKSRSILILGAGLVGLHLAQVLSGIGREVLVLEISDQILPGMVNRQLAPFIERLYERKGIRIRLGTRLQEIHRNEAILSSGESVVADVVLAAVGVKPNTELVRDTAVAVKTGILVNGSMETSLPRIYACGDAAEYRDFFTGRSRLNTNVISAAEQGKRAAESIMGRGEPHPGLISTNTFRCMGSSLFSLGRFEPDPSDRVLEEMDEEKGSYKRLVFQEGRLKGMLLLNCPADGGVYYDLLRRKILLEGMEEEIFGDPLRWGKRLAGRITGN